MPYDSDNDSDDRRGFFRGFRGRRRGFIRGRRRRRFFRGGGRMPMFRGGRR